MESSLTKTIKSADFNNTFTEIPHNEILDLKNPTQLRLFHLNVQNNLFTFDKLEKFIKKNIGRYVFSRAQIEEYIQSDELDLVGLDAINIMKKLSKERKSSNELGEILLYIFLEQVLNAPKILSKTELLTTAKQHDSKCDAIHLLTLKNGTTIYGYNMIFGTSDIQGDIRDAIDSAFKALKEIHSNKKKEHYLAENTIFTKNVTSDEARYIKNLLIPSPTSTIPCDSAYAIFLGYDLGLNPDNYSNIDFRKALSQKMDTDIKEHSKYIVKTITENNLQNHSFYIYVVPFNDAVKDKFNIINIILEGVARDE